MTSSKQLADWIRGSRKHVVFTGAGISTESGIPDFRSPGGVWTKFRPVYFDEFLSSEQSRAEYWRQKCEAQDDLAAALPNQGHRVLARWESDHLLHGVITQNIDGLHQLAGSRRVLEIHGTARWAACLECGDRQPIQPLVDEFKRTNLPPICLKCGGPQKHATVSFGQSLDERVLAEATTWMCDADLVTVLGSSLQVHPAASLPQIAVERGARLVLINRDPTPLDSMFDMVLHQSISAALTEVDFELRAC